MIKLTSKIDLSAADVFYDERFKLLIEQHLNDLIMFKGNTFLTISALEMDVWKGNLYGYLFSESVPVFQHWIIMRMNGMDSTLDFHGDYDRLVLPDVENITRLRELFNTVYRI